jgi:hypothetical protein
MVNSSYLAAYLQGFPSQESDGSTCSSLGLRDTLFQRLGIMGQATEKHPVGGTLYRSEFGVCLKEKLVLVERHLKEPG